MGNSYGCDQSVPPGGALLYIQRPGCFVQPSFTAPQQPFCVPMVSSVVWTTFEGKVKEAASKMYSEKSVALLPILLLPLVTAPHVLGETIGALRNVFGINVVLFLIAFGVAMGLRWWTIQQNQVQDQVVQTACNELATASGWTVSYRTHWIGFCKPKGAQPYRAIAISSSSTGIGMSNMGMPAAQTMSIMVPEGAGPGTTLQVQTPQGAPMQVTVPEGVFTGQTFQVTVPQSTVVTGMLVEAA